MNPNQQLIDYQNLILQNNLASIQRLDNDILSVQSAIDQFQLNIGAFNTQIADFNSQITALQNGNTLINDTIAILSQ